MGGASPLRSTRPRRTRTGCQAWPCRAAVTCTACTETSRARSSLVPSSLPKRERCCCPAAATVSDDQGLCTRGAGRTLVEVLRCLMVGKLPRCRETDEADHERAGERHAAALRIGVILRQEAKRVLKTNDMSVVRANSGQANEQAPSSAVQHAAQT